MHERFQELAATAAPAVAGVSALDLGDAWERLLEMAARQDAELVSKKSCRRTCGHWLLCSVHQGHLSVFISCSLTGSVVENLCLHCLGSMQDAGREAYPTSIGGYLP